MRSAYGSGSSGSLFQVHNSEQDRENETKVRESFFRKREGLYVKVCGAFRVYWEKTYEREAESGFK